MVGIDTNILLYAYDGSSPFFEPARRFIASACEEGLIGLADLSLLEFYSVITDGRKIPYLMTARHRVEAERRFSIFEFRIYHLTSDIRRLDRNPRGGAVLRAMGLLLTSRPVKPVFSVSPG